MRQVLALLALAFLFLFNPQPASADFLLSSSILEFNKDTPTNQDIDLISRSKDNDYIVTEASEIIHPGMPDESRQVIDDPAQASLLVTPDKTVLAGGGRKVLRFVLLKDLDQKEHIYRVKVEPVIRGLKTDNTKVGLKILVGYEVLVIVRPITITTNYSADRKGQIFKITNNGNSNVLFQNGKQCISADNCKDAPVMRVYPGETREITLPVNGPVTYSVWDGQESIEKEY